MNVKIHAIHFNADEKLENFIRKKMQKVDSIITHIIDAQVTLKLDHNNGAVKDKIAEIKVQLPGKTLFAEESSKLFEESVELAADSIVRQAKRHKEKIRN